jgi:hypothetical protein
VSFRRSSVIPDSLWYNMPKATRRLACYEKVNEIGGTRVFPFFTVEAKKAVISTGDTIGKLQSLNNASQALHNMFEFFRDAGPTHEENFYDKVRFFSVVASTEGLTIRIHRATRDPADGSGPGLIIWDRPEYPLIFEHQEFCKFQRDGFDRQPVLEMLERILLGYGANELHSLLKDAAKAIMDKLCKDVVGIQLRGDDSFYTHGQILKAPKSKTQTPAISRAPSRQNNGPRTASTMEPPSQAPSETYMSVDMPQSGTTTPTQSHPSLPAQAVNVKRKRGRPPLGDTGPARKARKKPTNKRLSEHKWD